MRSSYWKSRSDYPGPSRRSVSSWAVPASVEAEALAQERDRVGEQEAEHQPRGRVEPPGRAQGAQDGLGEGQGYGGGPGRRLDSVPPGKAEREEIDPGQHRHRHLVIDPGI